MHWYLGVLKKYAVFSGRARRAEFWYFVLFSTIISIVLAILDGFMSGSIGATPEDVPWDPMGDILTNIYNLAILIPSIAVSTRRLHDVDKSGWWPARSESQERRISNAFFSLEFEVVISDKFQVSS